MIYQSLLNVVISLLTFERVNFCVFVEKYIRYELLSLLLLIILIKVFLLKEIIIQSQQQIQHTTEGHTAYKLPELKGKRKARG